MWPNNTGVCVERGLELFQPIPGAEFHLIDRCAHWVQCMSRPASNAPKRSSYEGLSNQAQIVPIHPLVSKHLKTVLSWNEKIV